MSKPLLQKNTRFLLTWLPLVLLVCSILFYVMLQMHVHHMQEKQLLLKQTNVWNTFLAKSGNMNLHVTGEYDIDEDQVNPVIELNEPRDTSLYYADTDRWVPLEILTGRLKWNNQYYLVTTYGSSTEFSHLIIKVFLTEGCILLLLLFAIILLNKRSSGILWRPFFSTMKQLDNYDINRDQSLALPTKTDTTEFDELNKVLTQLIDNVNTAYHHQKQFVENASHEMQTPLAIIRSKLELLINQPNLTEKDASLLEDITQANNRLSQMNRTLLLLAKIESNQFPEKETVNIAQMLTQSLYDLQQQYENFPELMTSVQEKVMVNANRSLMEILVSNLVKNAVIHNQPAGKIKISLSANELLIENTGAVLETPPEQLFERFSKGSHQSKTTGLGLALVKQICTLYDFPINYQYDNGWHRLKLVFG